MIQKTIVQRKTQQPDTSLSSYSSKMQQILAARGINTIDQLDYGLQGLLPPIGLKNIQQASEYLFEAISKNQSIMIIGDFDADGATSTAVMMKALKSMGANRVNFLVPDRFKFGYGLSVSLVEYAANLSPDLIVTVDNGIANIDGVAKANQLGIPVIITDHHLPAEKLPDALAIVNPNQPGDEFASKNLAGVGVAFYLMLSLRALMRSNGWFVENKIDEPNLAELLDIVALGTVADVVVLDKNNRILVEQGLKRIRSGLACAGIKALLQLAKRNEIHCRASDLGFAVGPRINAAGRLEDMSIGINCLLADDVGEAISIASQLDHLNRSRRNIEQEMLTQADLDIGEFLAQDLTNTSDSSSRQAQSAEQRPSALCLFDPSWHQGVIGILASRVKDKINRPVIVFARGDDTSVDTKENTQTLIKGSCRSVAGVHIRDVLAIVDSQHPNLIEKFGGHAMAAGLSIKQTDFQQFAEIFHDAVETYLAGEVIKDEMLTDGGLSASQLSLAFAQEIRATGPWGQGFPEPLFDGEFEVIQSRILGDNHLKLVLGQQDSQIDGIYFFCPQHLIAEVGDKLRLVYKLEINEFRGNQTTQLLIEQLEIL